MSSPGMLDCPHHLALCYSVYRCQRQLKSALFSPPGLVNELIGLDTSRSLNRGVSACARLRYNNLKTIHANRNCSHQALVIAECDLFRAFVSRRSILSARRCWRSSISRIDSGRPAIAFPKASVIRKGVHRCSIDITAMR